jgi:hypothetical protein
MADDRYLQNRQLAYDLLKREGYTDIGDSAEDLFRDRENSRIAYDLLSKAGYSDLGKDYEEFASKLYAPEVPAGEAPDPLATSSFSQAPRSTRRWMRGEERKAQAQAQEPEPEPQEPAAPETSSFAQAPESTKDYLEAAERNPYVGRDAATLAAMAGEVDRQDAEFAKEYEARNASLTTDIDEMSPTLNAEDVAWLKENEGRYKAYKDKKALIANALTQTSEFQGALAGAKDAGNAARERLSAPATAGGRTVYNDRELKNWETVRRLSNITERESKLGDKAELKGVPEDIAVAVRQFAGAAGRMVDENSLTFGLVNALAKSNVREVGDKAGAIITDVLDSFGVKDGAVPEDRQEEVSAAIAEALQNGLTDGEKEVLKAFDRYSYINGVKAASASTYAKAGQAAEQSAEFMLGFILTGGLEKMGARAARNIATKATRQWLSKGAAARGASNIAADLPGAMAKLTARGIKPNLAAKMLADAGVAAERTALLFPRTAEAYADNLILTTGEYKDEHGRLKFDRSRANAALNTALTQYIEYWSEGFGEYFGAGEKALFKSVTKNAPASAIGKTLSDYRGSIGRFLDQGKFNGMFNEMLEEVVGSVFNSTAGWLSGDRLGDKEAMKEFFAGDNLATLFLSFLPMSALSARTNIKAYNAMVNRYDKAVETLKPMVESGAVSQEDLDSLVGDIRNSTPEHIKDRVVEIADKARKAAGGKLPDNFAQSLLGYVEGNLSMNMESDLWDQSSEKRRVVDAYSGTYSFPDLGSAWDIVSAEDAARQAALEAGLDEDDLEKDPFRLAQEAAVIERQGNAEAAEVLTEYAQVKAAAQGLRDGYRKETEDMIDGFSRTVWDASLKNGAVIVAEYEGTPVIVLTDDASVDADGSVSAGGADGLVRIAPASPSADELIVKSGTLRNGDSVNPENFIAQSAASFADQRQVAFEQAVGTISPSGKAAVINGLAGQTILIQDETGSVSPVTIVNTDGRGGVTVRDEGKGGSMNVVSAETLYDMAQKDQDGNVQIYSPQRAEQPAQEEQPQPAEAPAPAEQQPTTDLGDYVGTELSLLVNKSPVQAYVTEVGDGRVYFEYEDADGNGRASSMTEQAFLAALQGAQGGQQEGQEAQPQAPAEEAQQGVLPRTKDGEVDMANMFNVDKETFAQRIPELVDYMNSVLGEYALKEVQKAYTATGEAVKKIQERIDKNSDLAKAPKLYKELAEEKQKKENYGALILAMRPERGQARPAATAAAEPQAPEAPVEGNVPDISDDTPEAAQERGYFIQNGNRVDRAAEDAVAATGADTKISFTKTEVVDAKYGLVDAKRIIPSHVADQENPLHFFAKNWQPKNRNRTDSAVAIQQMANGIRPEEITVGATAYGGAPIVNSRGEVIQGNGRSEALRRAYAQDTAAGYKQWLAEHAEDFGLTKEQVEGMDSPILVRVLSVDDARAEELGKREQKDLESGGDQTFSGKGLAKKIGDRLEEFLNILYGGDLGEDATLSDYINANGQLALNWLNRNGYINDTELQNALETTRSGEVRFTDASVAAFRELSLEPLFQSGTEKVRAGYEKLPNIVKLALQRNVALLSNLEGVIPDIQAALSYYHDFETADPAFQKAKTTEEAWKAIEDWMNNVPLGSDKTEGDLHPNIVARRFAAIFKGAKKAKALTDLFRNIAAAMNGEGGLFGENPEAVDRIGAYTQTNVISEQEANTIQNGQEGNTERGSDSVAGEDVQRGGQVGEGSPASGVESPAENAGDSGQAAEGAESAEEGAVAAGAEESEPAATEEVPETTEPAEPAAPATEGGYGESNTVVTKDQYEELKRRMREKLGQLNAGFDPEVFSIGVQMAAYHIEAGARKFIDFAKRMINDLGDAIRPYLKAIYNGARDLPGMEEFKEEMDSAETVSGIEVADININDNDNGKEDTTDLQQGGQRPGAVPGDTSEGAGGETGTPGTDGDNAGDNSGNAAPGGNQGSDAEEGAGGEQGTLWDDGEPSGTSGNREGHGGRTDVGEGSGRKTPTGKGGRSGNTGTGVVSEGPVGVGRDTGGRTDAIDPEAAATEAEQKAYEQEKKAIQNETDAEKLKARKDELKAGISAITDKHDLSKARMSGQLRAVLEKLRDLFSKSADKSERLTQEKVPYESVSDPSGEHAIGSVVPSGSADAMRNAILRMETEEKEGAADFVRGLEGYKSLDEMFTGDGKDIGLSSEQVDSVALALHQMLGGRMFIVGDMTGVGKGRQGAAIIRWALREKKKILFVTEKPDLFSDMYQDLVDIGSTDHVPFVVNNVPIVDKGKSEEEGNVILKAPGKSVASALYGSESDALPKVKWSGAFKGKQYNVVMMTYSQAQSTSPSAKKKLDWVKQYAKDAIVICDESHNASGESRRGGYFRDIVQNAQGVTFMSATFAKRPDNMVLYALRSSLRDAQMTQEDMIESIQKYGVPMQEILAEGLFRTGEMVRRERDFSDVKIHWDEPKDVFTEEEIKQSRDTYDKTTDIVNSIISMQRQMMDPVIKKMNKEQFEEANKAARKRLETSNEGTKVTIREYTYTPYASQVSNVASLMFYAIKARKAAEMAINQIKEGKKPIIAVDNTLESYIKDIEGEVPSADFAFILNRGLEKSLKYRLKSTVKWINPETHTEETVKEDSSVSELGSFEKIMGNGYSNIIRQSIQNYSQDKEVLPLMLSPIDYIKSEIEKAGYRCGEITGRSWSLRQKADGNWERVPMKIDKTSEITHFNGGSAAAPLDESEVNNAVILNTAGATGISLHASRRFGDQRKRTMIILQPAKDVNVEVQIRGRGDRTGQVARCEYFYIMSPIPAEKKIIMMLKQKLASLDANAVGTEKVSSNKVDANDMDNKYGDEVARQFLIDHPEVNQNLDDPIEKKSGEYEHRDGLLYELLKGAQRMSCKRQELILTELESAYVEQIDYLNQNGINDLATTTMNLNATTVDQAIFIKGKDNESMSVFAHDTNMERVEVDVLKKPLRSPEIYARMRKLGALTEDGKIDPLYGTNIYEASSKYRDEVLRDKEKKNFEAQEQLVEALKVATPKTDDQTEEDYDRAIRNDPSYRELVSTNMDEYNRLDMDLSTQVGRVERAGEYLKPGMPVLVPLTDDLNGQKRYGRFIAFKTAKDGKPKSVRAVFAVTDARAVIEIPVVSKYDIITWIVNNVYGTIGLGSDLREIGGPTYDKNITDETRRTARDEWWDKKVPKQTTRQIRYMITGNILQACGKLGEYKGTITTFTRKDTDTGEVTVDRGMLLAEDFDPENFKIRSAVTKDDVWNGYNGIYDDKTNIEVRRDGDVMVVQYLRPLRSRENLAKNPLMLDEDLKPLLVDNTFIAWTKDTIRATVTEENVEAVLDHLYRNYGFTKETLFIMPDSTERVDAIVYTDKPYEEVLKEFHDKYGNNLDQWDIERQLKQMLDQYKMDVNNEDLKKQIRDFVQARQAYLRKKAAKNDSIRMAWDVLIKDEEIAQATSKERRDSLYAKREAEKEELAVRGVHGNLLHFEAGEVPFDVVEENFNKLNKDKGNAEIAKKVFPLVKKLGLTTIFNEKTPNNVGGHTAGQELTYNWKYMNSDWITDQMKADTFLHEVIHTVTAYAKGCVEYGYEHLISEEMLDIVNQLDGIWRLIKYNQLFQHSTGDGNAYTDYGTTDWYEMMAEAGSNEEFRADLRKMTLGIKVLSGVMSFTNVTDRDDYTGKTQNAEEAVLERLDALIEGFNQHAFTEYFRGTGFGARSYSEINEADNKAQEFKDRKEALHRAKKIGKKAEMVLSLHTFIDDMTDTELLRTNYLLPGNKDLEAEIRKRNLDPHPEMRMRDGEAGATEEAASPAPEENAAASRITDGERRGVDRRLDSMSEILGVPIRQISRDEMPAGHKRDKGYYDTATGEVAICMDNVSDLRDAMATVFHETVGHLGLRRLFGDKFNEAMVGIYSALDSKGRAWVSSYMLNHGLQPGDAGIVRGMEEYLASLAESGDFRTSVWDDIKRAIGRIVDAIFGTDGFLFTDRELNYILRASYEQLKNPDYLSTMEGWAWDTHLKRELGINETDPNRPTDPDGPGTGRLFRDGDSGVAKVDYESEMRDWRNTLVMEHQNADLPVKIGMEKIMQEVGKDKIEENEDYLTRHNLASSRAESQAHEFELFRFTPLLEQLRKVQAKVPVETRGAAGREESYEKILDYLYAVSGIERNDYKNNEIEQRKQEALDLLGEAAAKERLELMKNGTEAQLAKFEQALAEKKAEIESRYEGMKRDWSGLTSLVGRPSDEWREAEDDAKALIARFRSEVGDDAALEELWERIRACTDYSLEHAYRHGLLTREEYERLHGTESEPRMWEYYLPLRGFDEETAEDVYGYDSMVHPNIGSVVVKKMNGRWTKADNPIANILNIAESEIVQGNDNWARQALYRFVLNAGENSLLTQTDAWYEKDPATGQWALAQPRPDETLEKFEARMRAMRENIQPDGTSGTPLAKKGRRGLRLDRIMANKAHANEHLIRLKVGGMDKMIWVNGDPAIAKAVAGLGRAKTMRLIRRASRALSNLFTTYSLDFTARNLIRDTIYSQLALITKEDRPYRHQYRKNWIANFGYGTFAYPMVKLMAEWESGKLQTKPNPTPKEQMFMDFMRDGGQTGYTIINSVSEIKKSIERSMRRAGEDVGKVRIPILGHYAKFVKTLNEGFELLTRFTAYETSRNMGRSGQRSAADAKEISVNFNRKGLQSGKDFLGGTAAYLGATHYFYNAGVQGFDNFLHLFKVNPVKVSAAAGGLVLLGVLTPMLNAALAGLAAGMGDDDGDGDERKKHDWYWNLPEWVRRNSIVLGTGTGYLAIPLAVELRAFYGLGDIAASLLYHKHPARNGFTIGLDAINTAAGILPVNPIEGYTPNGNISDAVLRTVTPDATMFIVDIATNRDYTGRPLKKVNPFSGTVPQSQSAYASTPKALVEACQRLAQTTGIDIAPGVLRDVFRNLGGGFYRVAEDVAKLVAADEERPRRWDDIPFLSGFTGHIDKDRSSSFETSALYDYQRLSEDVVKRLNIAAGTKDITSSMAYDHPENLPKEARVQKILEGEDYVLGKMFRDGMNNEYKMKVRQRDAKDGSYSKGDLYKSREIERKGVEQLKKDWKELLEQLVAMPGKTQEEKDAKAAFSLEVQDAWHKYHSAESDLVDALMEEEYNHVQEKRRNGIPYEPKQPATEKVYERAREIVKNK